MKVLNLIEQVAKERAADSEKTMPLNINHVFTIAKAFRELEQERDELQQRAEAAEAKIKELEQEQAEHDGQIANLQGKFDLALAGLRSKTSRCDKAEEKLAELEKQEPVAMRYRWAPPHMKMPDGSPFYGDWKLVADAEAANPGVNYERVNLYTRPAPAINLAELVPDGWKLVPVEPTDSMIVAVSKGLAERIKPSRYRAMLAAAPEPD